MNSSSQKRLEQIRDLVYGSYAEIYHVPLRIQAIQHTSMTEAFARYLARLYDQPEDLAVCAAVLHDWARYHDNISRCHALKGAEKAQRILEETRLFSSSEIRMITRAVALHSQKDKTDDPLSELLKDADTLAFWAAQGNEPSDPARERRLGILLKKPGEKKAEDLC